LKLEGTTNNADRLPRQIGSPLRHVQLTCIFHSGPAYPLAGEAPEIPRAFSEVLPLFSWVSGIHQCQANHWVSAGGIGVL